MDNLLITCGNRCPTRLRRVCSDLWPVCTTPQDAGQCAELRHATRTPDPARLHAGRTDRHAPPLAPRSSTAPRFAYRPRPRPKASRTRRSSTLDPRPDWHDWSAGAQGCGTLVCWRGMRVARRSTGGPPRGTPVCQRGVGGVYALVFHLLEPLSESRFLLNLCSKSRHFRWYFRIWRLSY